MVNKEQEPKKALNEDRKKFLEDLQRQNGAGQGYIDYVLEQSKATPKDLEEEEEITRVATKIVKDENIQKKVDELYSEISKKLDPTKLLGNSPHKDTAAYYAENAHKYVRDEKGNYILRKEYLVGAVAKQVSTELVARSREDKKQEEEKNTSKNDGR